MDVLTIAAGVALGVIVSRILDIMIHHGGVHRDATDEPGNGKRSGLLILRDYGTGVEYVCSHFGMCARLDANSKPVAHPVKGPLRPATQRVEE